MNFQQIDKKEKEQKENGVKVNRENPMTLTSDFVNPLGALDEMVMKSITDNNEVPYTKDIARLRKYGLNWNPNEDMDLALAEAQGAGSKIANSLVQTIAEVGIGIPLGFADLVDLVGNAVSKNDNDYQNPVTRWLEEAKQSVKDWAPIYTDPNLSIDNGGLTNIGWLASNFPSVASSLSLLIPSMGVTKGVSTVSKLIAGAGKATKGMKAGEVIAEGAITLNSFSRKAMRALTGAESRLNRGARLNRFQEVMNSTQGLQTSGLVLENGLTAAMSRAMENYQESRQTYDDVMQYGLDALNRMSDAEYQEWLSRNIKELNGVDTSNRTEVAKRIASNAADLTNKMDWLNVTFDIIQLFALRNAWKGFTNSGRASAEVKQLNREAAAKFKPVTEGATEEAKKFAQIKKAGNWVKNKVYDSPFVVAAQLSEGVEEAVNYVAQQEGINYGKVLLDENQSSNFDTRLQEYMRAPELHDAAFWGVMGGVIFQKAGSGFNRLRATIDRKNREKLYKDSEELAKQPWYKFEDLADIKAQKSDINARVIDTQKYIETLKKINDGLNPYSSTGSAEFASEVEKEDAKEQAYNEWLTGMTLRAVNAGTIDMQKAFITDDNVKAAMVEAGIATEQTVDEFADATVAKIQEIEDLYNNELIHASHASAYLKKNIPAEYLNLIATNNVYNKRSINILNKSVNSATDRINVLLQDETIQEKIKAFGEFNYDSIVKLVTSASRLRDLRSTKKKLNEDNKDKNNLSAQISIQKINKEIEEIENNLNEEELVYATWQSLATYDEKGNLLDGAIESTAYKDAILVNRMGQVVGQIQRSLDLDISDRAKTAVSDATVNRVLELDDIIRRENELKEISPELFILYSIKHHTQQAITALKSDIIRSVDDVSTAVANYDKMMNIAKINAIAMANGTLQSLYKKYGNEIKDLIIKLYNNEKVDTSKLDSSELEILKDSLNILDITNENNLDLLQNVYKAFDDVDARAKSNEIREDFSTSETSKSEAQNSDLNNKPQAGQKPVSGQENEQGGNLSPENQTTPSKINLTDDKGNKYAELELTDGTYGNDVYELKIIDLTNAEALKYVRDDNFFANPDTITTIDYDHIDIEKNPKVVYTQETNTITRKIKGVIKAKKITNEEAIPVNELNQIDAVEETPYIPSTGGEEQTPMPGDLNTPTEQDLTEYMISCRNSMLTTARNAIIDQTKQIDNPEIIKRNVISVIKSNEQSYRGLMPGLDKDKQDIVLNQIYTEVGELIEPLASAFVKAQEFTNATFASKCVDIAIRKDDKKGISDKDYLELIDLYCKEKNVKQINNTYYISLENLLRFANSKFGEHSKFSSIIFHKFRDFINNHYKTNSEHLVNGDKYYVITDRLALDYADYLENVYRAKADKFKQKLGSIEDKSFELDIFSFLDYAKYNTYYDENGKELSTDEVIKQFNDTLNTLLKGDELEVRIIGKDAMHLGFFKNGKICATIPITTYDEVSENTGVHTIYNDGWITDINDEGPIVSNLRNLFSSILKDKEYSDLRDVLFEDTFSGKTFGIKGLQLFQQKIDSSYIAKDKNGNPQYAKAYHGLCKLLKYTGIEYEAGDNLDDENLAIVEESLDDWFLKIRDSYNFAHLLKAGIESKKTPKVLVTKAGNDIIEYTTTEKKGIPSERLAGLDTNPLTTIENYKIAFTNSVYDNIFVAGKGLIPYSKATKQGYTYVVAYSPNGEPRPIGAYPQNINSKNISNDAKNIVEGIKSIFENTQDLRKTILDFFPSEANNNVLLKIPGFSVKDGDSYTQFRRNSDAYKIYDDRIVNPNGDVITKEEFLNFLFNNAVFYLSNSLIVNDNNNTPTNNNIIKKDSSGITITINGKEYKYRTYNDFILKNDLVTVTTDINSESGTNFMTITSQRANEEEVTSVMAKIIPEDSTSPVEENDESSDLATESPRNVVEILNDSSIDDKGNAILDTIDDDDFNYLKNLRDFVEENASGEKVQLLPKNIQYDDKFNKDEFTGDNAQYKVSEDKVTVGKKWLGIYNRNLKQESIRILLHEQLHSILRDKKENKNITRIQPIYNEFSKVVSDKTSDAYKKLIDVINSIKGTDIRSADVIIESYLFNDEERYFKDGKITDEGLEEFLIESLSSKYLSAILNNIEVKNAKVNEPKTLLQKILKFLSDLFGWGINENSLYAKELNLLGKPSRKQTKEIEKNLGEKIEFTDSKDNKREFYIKDNVIYKKDAKPLKQKTLLNRAILQYELDKDLVKRISYNGRTYVLTTNGLLHEYSIGFIKPSSSLYENVVNSTAQQELEFAEEPEAKVEGQQQSILNEEATPPIKTDMFSTRTDIEDYTDEMKEIKAQAIADGTFMKAPNGNPTNLNERQWLQVRTKAFKEWFGDWQKASRRQNRLTNLHKYITASSSLKDTLDTIDSAIVDKKDILGENEALTLIVDFIRRLPIDFSNIQVHYLDKRIRKERSYYNNLDGFVTTDDNNIYIIDDTSEYYSHDVAMREQGIPVFVHELIHHLIHKSIDENPEFRRKVEKLYTYSIDYLKSWGRYKENKERYGFTNIHEFVSEAVSNLSFANLLKSIPSTSKEESIFSEFLKSLKEALEKIFSSKIGYKGRTVLDDIYDLFNVDKFETYSDIDVDVSKVVDENGEPLVVYHGTSRRLNNNSFKSGFIFASDNDIIGAGYGFQRKGFSAGIDYALSNFAGEDTESFKNHVANLIKGLKDEIEIGEDMPFYQEGDLDNKKALLKELQKAQQEIKDRDIFKELEFNLFNIFQSVKNPLVINAKGKYWHSIEFEGTTKNTDEIAKTAKDRGYDGLIVKNVIDKGAEVSKNGEYAEVANDYIAFESNQIKSATDNVGTFSRNNNDIRYSTRTDLGEFNSLNSYITSQPVQEQEFVRELVENGINTIKCK